MEITFEPIAQTRVETESGVYLVTPSYDGKLKTITVDISAKEQIYETGELVESSASIGWITYYTSTEKILRISLALNDNIGTLMAEAKEIIDSAVEQLSN